MGQLGTIKVRCGAVLDNECLAVLVVIYPELVPEPNSMVSHWRHQDSRTVISEEERRSENGAEETC